MHADALRLLVELQAFCDREQLYDMEDSCKMRHFFVHFYQNTVSEILGKYRKLSKNLRKSRENFGTSLVTSANHKRKINVKGKITKCLSEPRILKLTLLHGLFFGHPNLCLKIKVIPLFPFSYWLRLRANLFKRRSTNS